MGKLELRQLWAERLADYKESGLTMKDWCAKTGHSVDRLSYWKHKFNHQSEQAWLPVSVTESSPFSDVLSPSSPPPAPTMQIQTGTVRIQVYPGALPEMLRDVLQALVTPC